MADEHDHESKTEEPTEKKLGDAVDKGNVPFSREVVTFGSLAGVLIAAKLMVAPNVASLTTTLRLLFANAGELRLEAHEDAGFLAAAASWHIVLAVMPAMAVIAVCGLVASLMQNMPQANSARIQPQYARIAPLKGLKRMFGFHGLTEFLKSVAKLVAVSLVAVLMVRSELDEILSTMMTDPALIPQVTLDLASRVVLALFVIALLLAIGDLALSRFSWRRQLRMTRQDVKDEHKQQEGDPYIKRKIRAVGRQRVSRRMMKTVPQATVVITNPTHFAVALRYHRDEGGAPVVVAKGVDYLALRIRALAQGHDIPVVENKPLARALYDQAEIGQMIPAEFYKAVAEIIHFLQVRKMYAAATVRAATQG
jgi:flagellar biosynthetic protein FlhB